MKTDFIPSAIDGNGAGSTDANIAVLNWNAGLRTPEELSTGEVLLMRLTSTFVVVSILCCAMFSALAKASAISAKVPIQIQVDATDTVHKVFSVIEIIPPQGEDSITLL